MAIKNLNSVSGYSVGDEVVIDVIDKNANATFTTVTSTVTTGTAPLTVTSTTKVDNLNADLLDDQTGSYYLDWVNATNKPDPTITVALTGYVTGTGNVTLTDLASGNMTITTSLSGTVSSSSGSIWARTFSMMGA